MKFCSLQKMNFYRVWWFPFKFLAFKKSSFWAAGKNEIHVFLNKCKFRFMMKIYIWCIKSAIYLLTYAFQLVLEPYAPHYRVHTSFLGAHTTMIISDRTDNSHSRSTSDYMHPMKIGNYENVRHRSPKIMLMLSKDEVL